MINKSNALPRQQMDYHRNMHRVPQHLRGGMRRYLERGIPPGSFMTAVLANDLMDAMGRADDQSIIGLHALCSYLYNDVPMSCRGSRKAVQDWCDAGGMIGKGMLEAPTETEDE